MRVWDRGEGRQTLSKESGLYLDICTSATEFLVTPLLMASVCLLSQGGSRVSPLLFVHLKTRNLGCRSSTNVAYACYFLHLSSYLLLVSLVLVLY